MQFTKIVLLFAAALSVSAAPGPDTLAKRSCGTLTGTPLKICQEACKATCYLATGGLVRKLCKEACDMGPLAARDVEPVAPGNPPVMSKEDAAKEAAAAKEVFDLEAVDFEGLDLDDGDVQVGDNKISKRNWKHKLCNIACDVACNSTVLALDQLECLKICKGKC